MNLVKYNRTKPVRPVFSTWFDELFNSSLSDFVGGSYVTNTPSINIIEENDRFLVEVASPGLDKDDFDVKIDNDHLVISASKENKTEDSADNFTRKEFNYTSFKRNFYLPDTVDGSMVDAKYKDGILTIELLKKVESVKAEPMEIKIK